MKNELALFSFMLQMHTYIIFFNQYLHNAKVIWLGTWSYTLTFYRLPSLQCKLLNPRPAGKFQTPFDSPVRELPVQGQKFDPEVTADVTGQVKVRIFDFSGLATSASKISMLSAKKANESAWIVSLTSVSIISCALWP